MEIVAVDFEVPPARPRWHNKGQAMNSQAQGPTPASTWQAVAGSPITDELLEWSADLFAFTDVILERSEAYRFVLSRPGSVEWPPRRAPSWPEAVEDAAQQWSGAVPDLLAEQWSVFREPAGMPLKPKAAAFKALMFSRHRALPHAYQLVSSSFRVAADPKRLKEHSELLRHASNR